MGKCFSVTTADGTLFYIGDTDASCGFPAPAGSAETFTLTAGGSATAAGATLITTTALPSGLYIPPKTSAGGFFLEFLAPGSTVPLLVELDNSSAIIGSGTSLAVKALPQAIPAGSVATWPVLVRGATTRGVTRNVNAVQSQASSATGFAGSAPGTQTAQMDLTIELSATAGVYNLYRIASSRQSAYAKIIYPQSNQNVKSEKVEGIVYLSTTNRTAQDNNIRTLTTTLQFINEPVESYGLAAA